MSGHHIGLSGRKLLVTLLASSSAGYSGRSLQFAPATCTAETPCPVAIMFHEWGGMNQDLVELAMLL